MNTATEDDNSPVNSRAAGAGRAYFAATGISAVGTAFGLLGATGATTAAGSRDNGAVLTGLYMAVMLVSSAVAVPYAPSVCRRFGTRRAFVGAQLASAVAWSVAGAALLVGLPATPVLLVAAPVFGITGGLSSVVRPVLTRCYVASAGTADAYAKLSVVGGLGWGLGAIAGGALLSAVPLGWGLVVNGVSGLGLVVAVERITPVEAPVPPRSSDHPWRSAVSALRSNEMLRWTALFGASSLLFLAPMTSLVVPIAQDLRRSPLVAGAGFLIAAFAFGELFSPRVVRMLSTGRADLAAGAWAGTAAGLTLVVLGVVSLLLTRRTELGAWMVLGVAFGATRYAARALFVGSAAESGPPEDASTNLAAAMLLSGLAAPLGTLGWSVVIGAVSADAAVVAGGAGAVVAGLVVVGASRRILSD